MMGMWKGKRLDDMTRDELMDALALAVEMLEAGGQIVPEPEEIEYNGVSIRSNTGTQIGKLRFHRGFTIKGPIVMP